MCMCAQLNFAATMSDGRMVREISSADASAAKWNEIKRDIFGRKSRTNLAACSHFRCARNIDVSVTLSNTYANRFSANIECGHVF